MADEKKSAAQIAAEIEAASEERKTDKLIEMVREFVPAVLEAARAANPVSTNPEAVRALARIAKEEGLVELRVGPVCIVPGKAPPVGQGQ